MTIKKLQNLYEYCNWTRSQYPFNYMINGHQLLEALHIVKDFDNCISYITNFICMCLDNDSLDLGYYNVDFLYYPDLGMTSLEKLPGGIPIFIKIVDLLDKDSLANAEPKNGKYIQINISKDQLIKEKNKKRDEEFCKFIHHTLKHEFKHIKTIWSNPDKDALYDSKKYRKDQMTRQEALSSIYGFRYSIIDTITYLLNEDEAIAHINALYDKYESFHKECIEIFKKEYDTSRQLNRTIAIMKVIEHIDNNYYFSILDMFVDMYERIIKNHTIQKDDYIRLYELYMIRYHLRNHKFFRDIIKDGQEPIQTEGDLLYFSDYRKLDEDLILEDSEITINGLKMIIGEIKRCLASAIFDDIRRSMVISV